MTQVHFLDLLESESYELCSAFSIVKYCEALWDEEWDVDGPFNLLPLEAQPLTKQEIAAEDEHIYMLANDPVYNRECEWICE